MCLSYTVRIILHYCREAQEIVNCLIGQYLSIVCLRQSYMLLQVMFLVEFGLVMGTRIIEILWHKSVLLEGLKILVTCLKCDDIFFFYRLHIF